MGMHHVKNVFQCHKIQKKRGTGNAPLFFWYTVSYAENMISIIPDCLLFCIVNSFDDFFRHL